MPKGHSASKCPKYFDTDYVIRTDSDGDWIMHENGALTDSSGDPRQYALITHCPFCGKKLEDK